MSPTTHLAARRAAVVLGFLLLFMAGALTPKAAADGAHGRAAVEDPGARAAVLAHFTATAAPTAAAAPAGFGALFDYLPERAGDLWFKPSGGCSSPVPLPAEFTGACREHDLGYDLLRYARSQGGELGAWARQAVDARFEARMLAVCGQRPPGGPQGSCVVAAEVAATAVRANSWRQRDLTPVGEPWLVAALLVGAGCAVAVGSAVAPARSRATRRR